MGDDRDTTGHYVPFLTGIFRTQSEALTEAYAWATCGTLGSVQRSRYVPVILGNQDRMPDFDAAEREADLLVAAFEAGKGVIR